MSNPICIFWLSNELVFFIHLVVAPVVRDWPWQQQHLLSEWIRTARHPASESARSKPSRRLFGRRRWVRGFPAGRQFISFCAVGFGHGTWCSSARGHERESVRSFTGLHHQCRKFFFFPCFKFLLNASIRSFEPIKLDGKKVAKFSTFSYQNYS